jgi:glycosyltransferase involved in cell wall biosynthesis
MTTGSTSLVMIMMPAFNREAFIEEAVQSVQNQTYPHWKLVIVDDGSTDKTLTIAKDLAQKDDRIELVELNHSGECNARNTALSYADSNTEFVAFLDSDDVWDPDLLKILIEALRTNKECVGSHGIARIVDTDGKPYSLGRARTWPAARKGVKGFLPRKFDKTNTTDFAMLVFGNFVPIGATLVHRWVFDKVGKFNPNTFIFPDWEMWIRISSLGPFAFINRELYKYRVHPANAPRPEKMIFAQEKQFFTSIYNADNLTDRQRTTLKTGYRLHQLYHGRDYVRRGARKLMRGKLSSSAKEFKMAIGRVSCALALNPFD